MNIDSAFFSQVSLYSPENKEARTSIEEWSHLTARANLARANFFQAPCKARSCPEAGPFTRFCSMSASALFPVTRLPLQTEHLCEAGSPKKQSLTKRGPPCFRRPHHSRSLAPALFPLSVDSVASALDPSAQRITHRIPLDSSTRLLLS